MKRKTGENKEKNEGERQGKKKKEREKSTDIGWVPQTVEKYWVMTSEWWCQIGWGVLSDEWWVMGDEWWKLSEEWWVKKKKDPNKAYLTNLDKKELYKVFFYRGIISLPTLLHIQYTFISV